MYDKNNIFAKIIRGEIDSPRIYEDDYLIALKDAYPIAPIHILIMPKGEYIDYSDFVRKAPSNEVSHFFSKIAEIAVLVKAAEYRVICNKGKIAGQTIFHFHTHLISGEELKKMTE